MIAYKKPCYPDDRHIELTAYIGPRRAGKRYFNRIYGANPRDLKEGYPGFITDEVFELYKNAGFSFLMPEGDAFYQRRMTAEGPVEETDFEKSDLYTYMKMAQKHGLHVYPAIEEVFHELAHNKRDFGEEEKTLIRTFIETLQTCFPDTFQGIMLTDEPLGKDLPYVREIVSYLRSEDIRTIKPDLDIFASMVPMYAGTYCYAISDSEKTDTEAERMERYSDYMHQCAEVFGEFCYDYYALACNGFLSPACYRNMELAAEMGKEKGIPVSITLQSCRMDTGYNPETGHGREVYRIPSYEDMRWQVYSSLAFGMRRIAYYTFWQHYSEGSSEVYPKAMLNYEPSEEKGYRKTEIYDAVAEVNHEILAFDHVFLRFRWQGCRVIRKSREHNIRRVKGGYEGGSLSYAEASRDTLIGCFINPEDNAEGYWIVNAKNPYHYEVNDVELVFEGAERLLYYRKGKEQDVPLENGRFQIRLGTGEGIFAIPYRGAEA